MPPSRATSAALHSARTQEDRSRAALVSSTRSLLHRRDIALYPLVLISIGAFALALSEALRPDLPSSGLLGHRIIIGGSLLVGTGVAAFAYAQEHSIGKAFRGSLRFYIFGASILLFGLALAAVLDGGLQSVAYTASVLVASYVGLVFPARASRAAVGGLLALTAVIEVIRPGADVLEIATVFSLIFVGWLIGLMPRLGYRRASWQALLLSRSDPLTGALNRRGFLDELAYTLRGDGPRVPIALLAIDLNGFKQVNDSEGHAAGDAILAFVGQTIPPLLPEGAAFGRLGGDEFAVLLRDADEAVACEKAEELRVAISERIGASFGVATASADITDEEAPMHTADRALYAAKANPAQRVQHAVVDALPVVAAEPEPAPKPALSYAELRRDGAAPATLGAAIFDGRWVMAGFLAIAAAGLPMVGNALLFGGDTFFEQVLRYLGIPWVLVNLALAITYRRTDKFLDPPRVAWWGSAVLVAGGVGAAALASGNGITSPIMAAFLIKALFDASMARQRKALENLAMLGGFWLVVLVCGPADVMWAAPYALVLIGAAHVLGVIGRRAFESARTQRVHIASTDALTGLLNRRGFEAAAEEALPRALAGEATLGVITFDLDDFKGINDNHGHAAGDQVLRSVAHLMRDTLEDAYALGRMGGDEFVALVPVTSPSALDEQIARLDEGLAVLVGGSIGAAIHDADGATLDALLAVADRRAYAVKQARVNRHRPRRGAAAPVADLPAV